MQDLEKLNFLDFLKMLWKCDIEADLNEQFDILGHTLICCVGFI